MMTARAPHPTAPPPWLGSDLRGEMLLDEPMAQHTTWRAGGAAEYFYTPADRADLLALLSRVPPEVPLTWVGLGSNLLVRDGGVAGLVVRTARGLLAMAFTAPRHLAVEAGVACAQVARRAVTHGLRGAEFLAGVPGSLGGALAMNAGAFGGETWDLVDSVEVVDRSGATQTLTAAAVAVGYRRVDLPDGVWLLGAQLKFNTDTDADGDGDDGNGGGRRRIRSLLEKRAASQPVQSASAGSVFCNPPGDHAARLLEAAGMKGVRIGGAMVSERHANFIINRGRASAADIERLIARARLAVAAHSGVSLTPEVRIIGRRG